MVSKTLAGIAASPENSVSVKKLVKAAFVGAKTVNGELAVPDSIPAKPDEGLKVKAATRVVKFLLATA